VGFHGTLTGVFIKCTGCLLAALAATAVCFYLMYLLISVETRPQTTIPLKISAPLEFSQSEFRGREVRKKPERFLPAEPPAQPKAYSMFNPAKVATADFSNFESPAEEVDQNVVDMQFTPNMDELIAVKVVRPLYPMVAVRNDIEGRVLVAFRVDEQGSVSHAAVLESEPDKIFDGAALKAIRQFQFEPPKIDGQPAITSGTLMFAFRLDYR